MSGGTDIQGAEGDSEPLVLTERTRFVVTRIERRRRRRVVEVLQSSRWISASQILASRRGDGSESRQSVPELTRVPGIQLNA